MRDYLEIGCTPSAESCQQVPYDDPQLARVECRAFINQLGRVFPPVDGASFTIRSNSHDFGTYYEVAIVFDDGDESACDYAYRVEAKAPEYWDDEARAELAACSAKVGAA